MKLGIATRFWGHTPQDLLHLESWLARVEATELPVFVAINVAEDRTDALDSQMASRHTFFPVQPWEKFVPALNALIAKAWEKGVRQLLLASYTLPAPNRSHIERLVNLLDSETLVVGARLDGHEFEPGEVRIATSALATPWNTFALWNLEFLRHTGFLLHGEALFDPAQAGDEEFVTIALIQQLFCRTRGFTPHAILTEVPGIEDWVREVMSTWSPERTRVHQEKLAAKATRSASQLQDMGVPPPSVIHLKP